jgi:hypothetical protein
MKRIFDIRFHFVHTATKLSHEIAYLAHTKTRDCPDGPFSSGFSFAVWLLDGILYCARIHCRDPLFLPFSLSHFSRQHFEKGIKESFTGRLRVSASLNLNVANPPFSTSEATPTFSSILIRFGDVVQ